MIQPERLFENFFDDPKIIDVRLANFGSDCLNRLTEANVDDKFTPQINMLTPPLTQMKTELGEIAFALGQQKGKTQSVNGFIDTFGKRISALYGVIADKLGGEEQPAMQEFYPQGVTEYTRATKPRITVLLQRLKKAATDHAPALGIPLATELQDYEARWEIVRSGQQQKRGKVSENRTERTTARKDVEIALTRIIHNIADRYPGNVQQCMAFFDFTLLTAKKKGKGDEDDEQKLLPPAV